MPFDTEFTSSARTAPSWLQTRRPVSPITEGDIKTVTAYVTRLADKVGGWSISFDATFRPGKGRGNDEERAIGNFRKFMSRGDRRLLPWVVAAEPNKNKNGDNPGFHLHGMLATRGWDVSCKMLSKRWAEAFGWAKVNPIRSVKARGNYCTKHLVRRAATIVWDPALNGQAIAIGSGTKQ